MIYLYICLHNDWSHAWGRWKKEKGPSWWVLTKKGSSPMLIGSFSPKLFCFCLYFMFPLIHIDHVLPRVSCPLLGLMCHYYSPFANFNLLSSLKSLASCSCPLVFESLVWKVLHKALQLGHEKLYDSSLSHSHRF